MYKFVSYSINYKYVVPLDKGTSPKAAAEYQLKKLSPLFLNINFYRLNINYPVIT